MCGFGYNEMANMEAYQDCNLATLGIEYIGQQERLTDMPLDMFTDLETKSSFLRAEGETVLAARDRSRKGYQKRYQKHEPPWGDERLCDVGE